MNSITKYIMLTAIVAAAPSVMAQTRTGFFLEDYTYRYQINPAIENSDNFFSIPALGNLNVGINGTLGVKDVLYNVDGRTTTFMNPGVSTSEVLSNIGDKNHLGVNADITILAMGFKAFGGYNTITLGARVESGIKLPGSIFRLLKEGIANKTYDIGNIDAYGRAYASVTLGHSRQITDEWRVGANLKVLVGAGNANINMERADLELGTDAWRIITDGEVKANVQGLTYETKVNDNTGHRYVNGVDIDGGGVAGLGFGMDLGAVYSPNFLPDFKFSASIVDLGFINWKNTMVASTNGRREFTTGKYTFNVDDDAPNSFDNEIDKIKDDFSALYELDDLGDKGSQTTGLGATMNLGAQYTLPMYKPLTVGLLNTTRFNGEFGWTDFRLSANWAPCRVFDASVSCGAGTFGTNLGWLLNLHAPGFNLFFGSDYTPTKLAKQGVPLSSNGSFNMGMNILF